MTRTDEPTGRPAQLPLAELFTQYLKRQMAAQTQGLGLAEPAGEVEPYDAVPVQPVDPQLAWHDTLAVARFFVPAGSPAWAVPAEWPALVAAQEPAVALAFCFGNFPQMVRNLQPLLAGGDLTALRSLPTRPIPAPGLAAWADSIREYPQTLLAAGVLRVAGQFDEAAALLAWTADAPAEWQAARRNEEAALAWHRGQTEQAAALWQAMDESVPVRFNRGMAALFLGHPAAARADLGRAVEQLPDTSAWHHLGQLYLALAAARG
jgi:hypothetical protein